MSVDQRLSAISNTVKELNDVITNLKTVVNECQEQLNFESETLSTYQNNINEILSDIHSDIDFLKTNN